MNTVIKSSFIVWVCVVFVAGPLFAADEMQNMKAATFTAKNIAKAPKAKIAILGGTFVNDEIFHRSVLTSAFTLETMVGVSPKIYVGESKGVPFYYVHAHGGKKWLETWVALYDLGVEEAIGGATAGAINKKYSVYDYIIPSDFMNFNVDRPLSIPREVYKDPSKIPLPRFVPAMDSDLRKILLEETKEHIAKQKVKTGISVFDGGVIVQARGGRFETVAEINMFAKLGGDVVTLNVPSEIEYARMLGIHYASIIVISNPAEGIAPWDFSLMKELYPIVNPISLDIVFNALPKIDALKDKKRVLDDLMFHPEFTSKKKD